MRFPGVLTFVLLVGVGAVSYRANARQQSSSGPVMDDSGSGPRAAPQLRTAPARGSIDAGGYSADAAVKARSALTADVVKLQIGALKSTYCGKESLPCGLDPAKARDENTVRLLAIAYLRAKKPADALAICLRAPEAGPSVHSLAGIAAELLGREETAEQQFRLAVHQRPAEENVFAWGAQLLLLDRPDQARQVFQDATGRDPHSVLLQTGLGASLYSQGHIPEALDALLKAAEGAPSSLLPYPLIASIAAASNREVPADLERRLNALVQRVPQNPVACFAYAVSLWNQQQDQSVEDLLKRAIAIDPALAQAHFRLAIFYSERGEHARAIPEYLKTLDTDPQFAEAHYRLGQSYIHTGQVAMAQQEFKQHQRLRAAPQGDEIDIAAVINRTLASDCGPGCP